MIVEPKVFRDERGFLIEMFNGKSYAELGINFPFVQDNLSGSCQGTLRGLHYQLPHPQGKLISVVSGEIFDVVVDIRSESHTFGQWFGVNLSSECKKQLWVPPGLAHGFYVLSEWAEVFYKLTDYYNPSRQHTILWEDPAIGIKWPILPNVDLVLSDKDLKGVLFKDALFQE